ncbi:cytochrome c oxidase subunit 4 [uncultured Friedmanniella sp.]|uniref:cytochrome c oxidase subunit 4 n=1 Tax=uncultured Friedmanniella sp. TaxID=335381 RepID=UPI0035CBF9FA
MKVEAWVFTALAVFVAVVTPVYWILSRDATGTAALIMTFFLTLMIGGYLALIARRLDARPEDKRRGEIAEGAGELGFFPPQSIWPLFVALTFTLVCLGPVFGWWLTILGFGAGAISLTGLLSEFYRGDHAH